MLFFKVLVVLLFADSYEIFIPESLPFQMPKILQQIDEIATMHLFSLVHCIKGFDFSGGADTTDELGTDQSDNSTMGCFWECVLTNIDMMKDGHLEYVGSEENEILKHTFDACSKKEIMKVVDGCPLAHMFLLCEYATFLEKATIDVFSFHQGIIGFAKNSTTLLMELKAKLEMIQKNIPKDAFNPFM
ncbi:unnamed protein product [Nezara viridula]|uniref:Uncharacterized protein n=1 Tax=Nezara viridula TaxID=85310 RepID=A0A9P0HPH3_NEZVI|nr:unnamed protein product [Nezara viridula]